MEAETEMEFTSTSARSLDLLLNVRHSPLALTLEDGDGLLNLMKISCKFHVRVV